MMEMENVAEENVLEPVEMNPESDNRANESSTTVEESNSLPYQEDDGEGSKEFADTIEIEEISAPEEFSDQVENNENESESDIMDLEYVDSPKVSEEKPEHLFEIKKPLPLPPVPQIRGKTDSRRYNFDIVKIIQEQDSQTGIIVSVIGFGVFGISGIFFLLNFVCTCIGAILLSGMCICLILSMITFSATPLFFGFGLLSVAGAIGILGVTCVSAILLPFLVIGVLACLILCICCCLSLFIEIPNGVCCVCLHCGTLFKIIALLPTLQTIIGFIFIGLGIIFCWTGPVALVFGLFGLINVICGCCLGLLCCVGLGSGFDISWILNLLIFWVSCICGIFTPCISFIGSILVGLDVLLLVSSVCIVSVLVLFCLFCTVLVPLFLCVSLVFLICGVGFGLTMPISVPCVFVGVVFFIVSFGSGLFAIVVGISYFIYNLKLDVDEKEGVNEDKKKVERNINEFVHEPVTYQRNEVSVI